MSVSPLPERGGVQWDSRQEGRALRVAAHPDLGMVTLSLWREDGCVATHQMAASGVAGLIGLLADALRSLAEEPGLGSSHAC
ncbi:MAG TPA: hypothetical protein VHW92_07530 [Mycobacteriales bacterium]|jgi:hypothetical protein|nr:hypothetical protein [Mycobacteriales bacterium]